MVKKELKSAAMGGFQKWLYSTKFQVCVMAFALLILDLFCFGLDSRSFADSLVKITVGYFGARVLEPAAEAAMAFIGKKKPGGFADD